MLFLVVSSPHPTKPEEVKNARAQIWRWIDDLKSPGKVIFFYPIVGRGAAAVFDVDSNDELHKLLTQWLNMVPAKFDIYPLATPSEAKELFE
jgi:muconolactone delta-isomerase